MDKNEKYENLQKWFLILISINNILKYTKINLNSVRFQNNIPGKPSNLKISQNITETIFQRTICDIAKDTQDRWDKASITTLMICNKRSG